MSVKYEGIIPPIVTPFTASGEIDEEKIRREMEIWMQALMESVLAEVPEKDRHYVMKS